MTQKVDTASRHRTEPGVNIFEELGFPPEEAARLLRETDTEIAEATEEFVGKRKRNRRGA